VPNEKVFARAFGIRGKRWITPELFLERYQIGHYPIASGVYEYPIQLELRRGDLSAAHLLSSLLQYFADTGGSSGRVVYTGYGNPYTLTVGTPKVASVTRSAVTITSRGLGVRRYDMPVERPRADGTIPSKLRRISARWAGAQGLCGDGVLRRSPSSILHADGLYHVWYRRERRETKDDRIPSSAAQIWRATSTNGIRWTEEGPALPASRGAWHSRGRDAPFVLEEEGRLWLFFSCAAEDGRRVLARAASYGASQRFSVADTRAVLTGSGGETAFDAEGVDHPCVLRHRDATHLYFVGRSPFLPADEVRVGVATAAAADRAFKRRRSAVMTSRTTCLWPAAKGLILIGDSDPPSLQYSEDGLRFQRVTSGRTAVSDAGVCLSGGAELPWGLANAPDGPGLLRFQLGGAVV
jgi:hypothetical protein